MSARAVDPARSRILLIGAHSYDDPQLADVPEIARNLADLAAVLTDARVPLQMLASDLTCRFGGLAYAARWYSLITPPRMCRRWTGVSSGTMTGPS